MQTPEPGARSPESWRPSAHLDVLRQRAALVDRVRAFFSTRGLLEIDTPVLQGGANLDPGVTPFAVDVGDETRFLPTSPEHPLKRLVAGGMGAVWTLAPAFRAGELGRRHAPEFRMLEWYRPGWDDRAMCAETVALLAELTGLGDAHEVISYREAFRRSLNLDPFTADDATLLHALGEAAPAARGERGAALDLLLATHIEPSLGRGRWTVMDGYPSAAAAQARLRVDNDGTPVAARFEIYRDGIELANGYWELTDADELSQRLQHQLGTRDDARLCRDPRFDAAMRAGLPDCAGVAVGFDRVVMLALGLDHLAATQAFGWQQA